MDNAVGVSCRSVHLKTGGNMSRKPSGIKFKWFICMFCGKPFTANAHKTRKFCSYDCHNAWQSKYRVYPKGNKNPNWKGGITPLVRALRASKEYSTWRHKVFSRDGFKCVICGHVGAPLHAHHVVPISVDFSKALEIDNGVTMCKDCHQKQHPEVMLFWGD